MVQADQAEVDRGACFGIREPHQPHPQQWTALEIEPVVALAAHEGIELASCQAAIAPVLALQPHAARRRHDLPWIPIPLAECGAQDLVPVNDQLDGALQR